RLEYQIKLFRIPALKIKTFFQSIDNSARPTQDSINKQHLWRQRDTKILELVLTIVVFCLLSISPREPRKILTQANNICNSQSFIKVNHAATSYFMIIIRGPLPEVFFFCAARTRPLLSACLRPTQAPTIATAASTSWVESRVTLCIFSPNLPKRQRALFICSTKIGSPSWRKYPSKPCTSISSCKISVSVLNKRLRSWPPGADKRISNMTACPLAPGVAHTFNLRRSCKCHWSINGFQ